jgi:hypothetical protein
MNWAQRARIPRGHPDLNAFFIWLETSALSIWVRESPSLFAFPTILSFHTLGMGIVAGLSAAIDLRILGFAPGVPLTRTKRYYPWLWFGFWLNAASGVVLLVGYPTKALTNPVFYLKLLLIATAMALLVPMSRRAFGVADDGAVAAPDPKTALRRLAIVSLVCWIGAITAGRLLAYTYLHLRAS